MLFNPDPISHKSMFFKKAWESDPFIFIFFNGDKVQSFVASQKHLGLILDFKFDFKEHLNEFLDSTNQKFV